MATESAPPPDIELSVALTGALFRGPAADPQGPTLLLDCRRRDGTWDRIWGVARNFNVCIHPGRVTAATVSDDRITLAFDLKVLSDNWTPGGRASFTVELALQSDGAFAGTYTGSFRNVPVTGRATAVRPPPPPLLLADQVPVKPGEHPRLLFRQSEVPALRKRAATPFGQACVERMNGAVGLGVRYQLSGDPALAEQARLATIKLMADKSLGSDLEPVRPLSLRLEQVAYAFDLCYDAWPADFRREVLEYFRWGCHLLFFQQGYLHRKINWHVASNYAGPIYAGPGIAGLAFWGEPGPAPTAPASSAAGARIDADPAFVPGAGVPVHPFADGKMPGEWLYAGGFPVPADAEVFGAGGTAAARPAQDLPIGIDGHQDRFRPLSHEKDRGYWEGAIDVTNSIGRRFFTTTWFYCVIDNDADRWVRVETDLPDTIVHLGGKRLHNGDPVRLGPGRHPLLVAAFIDWTNDWGRHLLRPRLHAIDETTAQADLARIAASLQEEREDHAFDLDLWERLGHADQTLMKYFEIGKRYLVLHYREGIGDGGFQAEVGHYSLIASDGPSRYAALHRTVFGVDASPHPDITHLAPRKIFGRIYRDGGFLAQDINGSPDLPDHYFPELYPVVPAELRPGILWAWNRQLGIADGDARAAAAKLDPVMAFLRYPLETPPRHPGECFPRTWAAGDFGYYGFRNGFDPDSILCQVFARAHTIGGWSGENTATFRLAGLGHLWAYGPTDRNRCRIEENAVVLPGVEHNLMANGVVTHQAAQADGSGAVSIDLNDFYAGRRTDAQGQRESLYETYGNIRRPQALVDLGIRGRRALAVDYSGRCGAPALVVIVDEITGAPATTWIWQLGPAAADAKRGPAGHLADTVVEGKAFTIRKADGAVLRATFATPAELVAEVRQESMTGRAASTKGKTLARPIPGVFATGDGRYFVIITLGRGEPPAVAVDGTGLDATVRIGGASVRYRDGRILIE